METKFKILVVSFSSVFSYSQNQNQQNCLNSFLCNQVNVDLDPVVHSLNRIGDSLSSSLTGFKGVGSNSGKLGDNFRNSIGGSRNSLFGGGNPNTQGVNKGGGGHGLLSNYQVGTQQQQPQVENVKKQKQKKQKHKGDAGSFNGGFRLKFNQGGLKANGFFKGGSLFSQGHSKSDSKVAQKWRGIFKRNRKKAAKDKVRNKKFGF